MREETEGGREGGRERERERERETQRERETETETKTERLSLTKRGGQGQENSKIQMAELYRDQAWGMESQV